MRMSKDFKPDILWRERLNFSEYIGYIKILKPTGLYRVYGHQNQLPEV